MKYGRNPGGLVVYVKNSIETYAEEIKTNTEEVIWNGMKDWLVKEVKICVGFLYCPPVNSKWFNVNF
jgi:hypothetical protein